MVKLYNGVRVANALYLVLVSVVEAEEALPPEVCVICGKPVSEEEAVRCADCDSPMHRSCMDPEVLTDAEGAPLCPACAALSALEWLDHVLSLYASAIREPRRSEITTRLRKYLEMLENS